MAEFTIHRYDFVVVQCLFAYDHGASTIDTLNERKGDLVVLQVKNQIISPTAIFHVTIRNEC